MSADENLNEDQFWTLGRHQVCADDIISRGDKGPMRVLSTEKWASEHGGEVTSIWGKHVDTGEHVVIHVQGNEKVRRHAE